MGRKVGLSRFDVGTMGAVERTPLGGLRIPTYLTRTGVFDYVQDDGTIIREYRPVDEVFNADSLATLVHAPCCNEHPNEPVTPQNFRKYSVGHVENGTVKQDGDKIAAYTVWQEHKAIADIEARRKYEISCGYTCDVDETSGTTPNGERYDRIQRNIRYNHVALVPDGRAGPEVRLRLDSGGNQTGTRENANMKIEVINGVEYEIGTAAHAEAVRQRDKRRSDATTALKSVTADRDKQKGRADAAEAELAKARTALKEAQSPQRLDKAVRIRAVVIKRASVVLPKEFKFDGLTIAQIKIAAVKARNPEVKLDGQTGDYINGMFRAIKPEEAGVTSIRRRNDNGAGYRLDDNNRVVGADIPDNLRQPPPGFQRNDNNRGAAPTMDDYRRRRNDAESERHRRPLAVSRSNPHRENDNYPSVQGSMMETMK